MSNGNWISKPVKVDKLGRVITNSDKAYRWRLDIPASFTGTVRKRKFFKTEKEANETREQLHALRGGVGPRYQMDLASRGMTVEDAVAYALKNLPSLKVLVSELIRRFIKHRREEVKVSERYMATLCGYLKKIEESFGDVLISDVSREGIRGFLNSLKGRDGIQLASNATRNHYLETFRALFSFAISEHLLEKSPTDGISMAIPKDSSAAVLSLREVNLILDSISNEAHRDVAPALLIQLFAGLRRCEVCSLRWEMLRDQFIRLDIVKGQTDRRPVEMPEVLLRWLERYRVASGYVFDPSSSGISHEADFGLTDPHKILRMREDAYAWRLRKFSKLAGVVLPKNVLRHTAITMRVNLTNDISGVARWAGNSPAVVVRNYLGVGTPADSKRFYSLFPNHGGLIIPLEASVEGCQRNQELARVAG
jgi:integrase